VKPMPNSHPEICAEADASVARVHELVKGDPLRPMFHVTAAGRFINDPNGPIYFNGLYHLFFQHLPYYQTETQTGPGWGHVVSPDLVHWSHWPIALMPVPGTPDAAACASGACVINNDGVPTIVYTSVPPQAQSLATSTDGLRTWKKYDGNPVIPAPPNVKDLEEGFRDPFVWKEGSLWHMAVGSGVKNAGGTILLYRSLDLIHWDYANQLCTGMDPDCFQWECPNFFQLGDRHVLIVSPLYHSLPALRGPVQYTVGEYRDGKLTPGPWSPLDLGEPESFYAPNSIVDPRGRRILWGWIAVNGSPGYPWHGAITLPRILAMHQDGSLGMAPAPELAALRGQYWQFENCSLEKPSAHSLSTVRGNCLEILASIEMGSDAIAGLDVLADSNFGQYTAIRFNHPQGLVQVGDRTGAFRLNDGDATIQLHLFIDRSVLELFINDRICFTAQAHPPPGSQGIRLIVEKGSAVFKKLEIWEMHSIWKEADGSEKTLPSD